MLHLISGRGCKENSYEGYVSRRRKLEKESSRAMISGMAMDHLWSFSLWKIVDKATKMGSTKFFHGISWDFRINKHLKFEVLSLGDCSWFSRGKSVTKNWESIYRSMAHISTSEGNPVNCTVSREPSIKIRLYCLPKKLRLHSGYSPAITEMMWRRGISPAFLGRSSSNTIL